MTITPEPVALFFLQPHFVTLRFSIFVTLLITLALAEWAWPRHCAPLHRRRRWAANLGLGALDAISLRVLVPWAAVAAAGWSQAHHVGVLHMLRLSTAASAVLGFAALDLVIYLQHRLMHRIGWLWRLHRVHHTDVVLDVSSGVRFHPFEILLSMGIKIGAVLLLGVAPAVVMLFEILLSSLTLFAHANLAIPEPLDRCLRWVVVTPDMHRIHHSVLRDEQHSNYGFQLTWWDRLLGSYNAYPRQPQVSLTLGLHEFRGVLAQRFTKLLLQPFLGERR